MALRLGELLIQKRLLTQAQLEQALKAQMIYGGRLGTNLVELELIELKTLGDVLAEQRGVPLATDVDFQSASKATIDLFTPDVAAKFLAFPLYQDGPRRLKVAMLNPYSFEDCDNLGFLTGMRIIPYIAPELILYFYLERVYGVTRDARYIRLGPDAAAHLNVPQTPQVKKAEPDPDSPFGPVGQFLSEEEDEVDPGLMPGQFSAVTRAAPVREPMVVTAPGAPPSATVAPSFAPGSAPVSVAGAEPSRGPGGTTVPDAASAALAAVAAMPPPSRTNTGSFPAASAAPAPAPVVARAGAAAAAEEAAAATAPRPSAPAVADQTRCRRCVARLAHGDPEPA